MFQALVVLLAGTILLAAATVVYAFLIEPDLLSVEHETVSIRTMPAGKQVRILHLTDLHVHDAHSLQRVERAIWLGLAEKPDLACLTGDYITGRLALEDEYRRVLAKLANSVPTMACLGNHDGGLWKARRGEESTEPVIDLLEDAGVTVLHNRSTVIGINGVNLTLAGVGDLWAGQVEPKKALRESGLPPGRMLDNPPKKPVILLCHNPDTLGDLERFSWDLALCGHTHGGQLSLPVIGQPLAPVRDKSLAMGVHTWDTRQVVVSRGVGLIAGARLFCRPQVLLLTVRGTP